MQNQEPLRVLMHASTAGAGTRACNKPFNSIAAALSSEECILANAEGITVLLDAPGAEKDALTLVCANTIRRRALTVGVPAESVTASILTIAQNEYDDWHCVRT